ncbi:MAG: alpha-mannosidase, partial [Propionibacterium sp.]|nr:alpha-mannosidase [Propionibacterium sp.]
MPKTVWIVPHTHWDREWYEPHDVFRARLVAMLDELLLMLEREPAYKFSLDGQSAAIEDYLEIRPEAAERVRDAVARGQLALGPFQILLDEFCCDGETIIRNLEHGIRAARRLGREMRVGYLPDMFGHAAQTPQILRGFGIADASLWRGVPAAVDKHAFVWEALDGSSVRVEYLWDGYGSALKLFEPLEKLPELIDRYLRENASWFDGEAVAGWYGTDHMAPRADLVQILRAYEGDVELKLGTIEDVIASRDHSADALGKLPRVRGELRSHARGNLLPGVFSIRTNLKAAMARAERALTSAERLDAWLGGPSRQGFFDRGWGLVIESTAHDSVTGCGVDSTAEEVEARLKVAEQTAEGAIDIALSGLATHAPMGSVAVFNQSG